MAFDLRALETALASTDFAGRLHHLATVDSTQNLAHAAAQSAARCGVWIADEQTAGRGRGGHVWHSVPGEGLYLSVLLRPRLAGGDALKLSLAAGLAAQSAIAAVCALTIDLRWPNDLMSPVPPLPQRKLGGILAEASLEAGSGVLKFAVIGVGINLNHLEFPERVRETATSLRILTGNTVSREQIAARLLREISSEVTLLEAEANGELASSIPRVTERFLLASTWTRGLRVHVDEEGGYTGVTDGLTPAGLLRVRLEDGTFRIVRNGGVRRTD